MGVTHGGAREPGMHACAHDGGMLHQVRRNARRAREAGAAAAAAAEREGRQNRRGLDLGTLFSGALPAPGAGTAAAEEASSPSFLAAVGGWAPWQLAKRADALRQAACCGIGHATTCICMCLVQCPCLPCVWEHGMQRLACACGWYCAYVVLTCANIGADRAGALPAGPTSPR